MEESREDIEITKQNHKLLSLVEHPVWGTFTSLIKEELDALDSISSLIPRDKNREELIREVEVRYHTMEMVRGIILSTIERANTAQIEIEESKSDIINVVEP